jgi:hypothetical protein
LVFEPQLVSVVPEHADEHQVVIREPTLQVPRPQSELETHGSPMVPPLELPPSGLVPDPMLHANATPPSILPQLADEPNGAQSEFAAHPGAHELDVPVALETQ